MRHHPKDCTSSLSKEAEVLEPALSSCEFLLQNTNVFDAIFSLYNQSALLLPQLLRSRVFTVQRLYQGWIQTARIYSSTELDMHMVPHLLFYSLIQVMAPGI